MATVTYPSGVSEFVTLCDATELGYAAAALGTVELGDGYPAYGQKAALGLLLQVTVVANSSTALYLLFDATNDDGTTWYAMDEYSMSVTAGLADSTFRLHLQPFTQKVTGVRVRAYGDGSSPAGTVAIDARLTGLYEVVGGVSS